MKVMRGTRLLSLAIAIVLACVWLVSYLLNGELVEGTNLLQQAIHGEAGD